MTHILKLASLAVLGGILTTSAANAQVTVRIDGRSEQELRADVVKAAYRVCSEEEHSPLAWLYLRSCVADTVDETLSKISVSKRDLALTTVQPAAKAPAGR